MEVAIEDEEDFTENPLAGVSFYGEDPDRGRNHEGTTLTGVTPSVTLSPLTQRRVTQGRGTRASWVAPKQVQHGLHVGTSNPASLKGTSKTPIQETKSKCGLWAHNLALVSVLLLFMTGAFSLVWHFADAGEGGIPWIRLRPTEGVSLDLIVAAFALSLAPLMYGYETVFGVQRTSSCFPGRFFVYFLCSLVLFTSIPTITAGMCVLITAIVNLVAFVKRESYPRPSMRSATSTGGVGYRAPLAWLRMKYYQGKLGRTIFLVLYFGLNVALFFTTAVKTKEQIDELPTPLRLSPYMPFAKGFGVMLDCNCAVVLLPALRSIIRAVFDAATADQGGCMRAVMYVIPLDENISFHKLIADIIIGTAFLHTVAHFLNYAFASKATLLTFGFWPWISGALLLLTLALMFAAAFDDIRRNQFEIFFYSHHLFIVFFMLLLTHSRNYFQVNFAYWFVGPGVLYLVERIFRVARAKRKVVVLSVSSMDRVISLEFDKKGILRKPYKEGQYLLLNAPMVAKHEWHPFTISSAPEQETVTVHIMTQGAGSWTQELKETFSQFGVGHFFTLSRKENQNSVPGKIIGPDGTALLKMDGPYAAPTQHASEYEVLMCIGAGIGGTPLCSTLKSIVFHKWRTSMGVVFPSTAYFYWIVRHKDLAGGRWMVRAIKQAHDEVQHLRSVMPEQMADTIFSFTVFVTSIPQELPTLEEIGDHDDDDGFWGPPVADVGLARKEALFSEMDLYRALMAPQDNVMFLGDGVEVVRGRPDWKPYFKEVAEDHPVGNIGVCFCGNPGIATDLGNECDLNSLGREGGSFVLHKENF